MKALPTCKRQEIAPVSLTARLAQKPRKILKDRVSTGEESHVIAVFIKSGPHLPAITRPPRIDAGLFSAEKIGTVLALEPIPIPDVESVR